MAISKEIQQRVHEEVDSFNAANFTGEDIEYKATIKGNFVYLSRRSYSVETKICRLKYTGDFNGWIFAIYKYSNENYDPDELFFPGMGLEDGTIKGAMAAGMEAYPL
ncbi:MAG: hypothetical protein HOC09_01835 [Deltaproteobacteria bacterium]|jgi:hypothetical protein|nr:hypothetical protein [Deltaproteobacteria bacterium]